MNHTTAVTHEMNVGKCLFILLVATHLVVIYADENVKNYDDLYTSDEYSNYNEYTGNENFGNYEVPDWCKKDHECNNDDLRHLPPMEQLYGKHVTKCCSNTHEYTFIDNCQVCILSNYKILTLTIYCIEC